MERVIRSLQQSLDDCGLKKERLHATGLQTLCKIVENAYNSLPIGYSYDRDQDNTEILKIICPNMLKMGHKNQRQLEGPIRLARGVRELVDKVEKLYEAWFLVWRDTVVPKIMFRPKWYNSDKDLDEGDLVYFQKSESKLSQAWTIGRVEQVVRSERDDLIRKVVVKYQNHGEDNPQFTDRHVRKLVKLFNIDEHQVQEDLAELQKRINSMQQQPGEEKDDIASNEEGEAEDEDKDSLGPDEEGQEVDRQEDQQAEPVVGQGDGRVEAGSDDVPARNTRSRKKQCNCCCEQHCQLSFHTLGDSRPYISTKNLLLPCELQSVKISEEDLTCQEEIENDAFEVANDEDTFAGVLMSVHLKM